MDGMFERHVTPMLLIEPANGLILDANPAAINYYGYSKPALCQLLIDQINILAPEEVREEMKRAASEQRNYFQFRHKLASGEIRDVEVYSSPFHKSGETVLFSIIYDVTETKRKEALAAALLRAIPLPLYYKDLEGRYLGCNEIFAESTGRSAEEIMGKTVFDLWQPDLAAIYHARDIQLYNHDAPFMEYESGFVNAEGVKRNVIFHKALLHNQRNELIGQMGIVFDITDRKQREELSHRLAFYDPLTRLPNRRLLNQRLKQAIATSDSNGLYGAMIFIDLDNFKPVNDLYGHDAGDNLLIEVAERLKAAVRKHDTVSRLGGDEFVLILESLGINYEQAESQAIKISEMIRSRISQPFKVSGDVTHCCTASIGLVLFQGETDGHKLLKQADQAMYEAKLAGRNRVIIQLH